MNKIPFYVFISFELLLFSFIIIRAIKIKSQSQQKVKGFQYETRINKNDIVFDNKDNFKYFYEPKPNSVETWKPDWLGHAVKNTINKDVKLKS